MRLGCKAPTLAGAVLVQAARPLKVQRLTNLGYVIPAAAMLP